VSLDGGAAWQPLGLNLPGVQVRDIAIDARQGAVVAATHGRAFWILDDLALLEQLTRDPQQAAAVRLFAPEKAWLSQAYATALFPPPAVGKNPDYGATIFFKVPATYDGKAPVTLSFQTASGLAVRTFDLHLKKKHAKKIPQEIRSEMDAIHQRAVDLADLTAIEPGMNRLQWDLRYAPATEVAGFREPLADDFSASVDGPTIVPGTYAVVLQYGATKLTQSLELQIDPRLSPSAEDLDARLALEQRIHAALDALDVALNAAIAAAPKLPAAQRAQLESAIGDLVQLGIRSSEGDLLHETKVRSHLAFLASELEIAYNKPTAAEYATFDELQAQAIAGEARLRGLTAQR
jgi:hypothetical protein